MASYRDQLVAAAIPAGRVTLQGLMHVPDDAQGLVLFAHGMGSSQLSTRNQQVANVLREAGLATLLFDLLAPSEQPDHLYNAQVRFDAELLAQRMRAATHWVRQQRETERLALGYFGAGTGAAVA